MCLDTFSFKLKICFNFVCSSGVKLFIKFSLEIRYLNISIKGGILLYSSIFCFLQVIIKLIFFLVIKRVSRSGLILWEVENVVANEFI